MTAPAIHLFTIDPGLDEVAIAHWTVPARQGLTGQALVRDHLSSMTVITTKPADRTSRRLGIIAAGVRDWVSGRLESVGPSVSRADVYAVLEMPARGGLYWRKEAAKVPLEALLRSMQAHMAASGVIASVFDSLGIEVWYWPATGAKTQRQDLALKVLKDVKNNGWANRRYPPDLLDAVAQGLQVMPYFVDLAHGRPLPGHGSILGRAAKAVDGHGGSRGGRGAA
jgi:hypothetical protein